MVQPHKLAFIAAALNDRAQHQRVRSFSPLTPEDAVYVSKHGQSLLNFSSNDYLGLSKHPALIEAAQTYAHQYGTGATASRLVVGTYDIHHQLESHFAAACGQEAALLFSSGFQANSTILPVLLDRQSLVLCDRLVHSSLIQGILSSRARFSRYRHNDMNHLETLLKKATNQSHQRILIATETLFSMDGDRSDVTALVQLARQYNAILYLDDAHALGVYGKHGMGLAAHHEGIDIVVGTFGKAFGSFGAVITCSQAMRDYLINVCPGLIYTTALPPSIIGAIAAALDLIPTLDAERTNLYQMADGLRQQVQQLGYDTGLSDSHIIPIIVGSDDQALRLSHWLETRGMLATAIRPPTVAAGTARIRVSLSSCHTVAHVKQLVDHIQTWDSHVHDSSATDQTLQ
jgi:8-amino-7-oxononanoate synthase